MRCRFIQFVEPISTMLREWAYTTRQTQLIATWGFVAACNTLFKKFSHCSTIIFRWDLHLSQVSNCGACFKLNKKLPYKRLEHLTQNDKILQSDYHEIFPVGLLQYSGSILMPRRNAKYSTHCEWIFRPCTLLCQVRSELHDNIMSLEIK